MGTEIERKFLIDSYEFMTAEVINKGFAFHVQVTQGYLSKSPTVRVRLVETGPNNATGFITVKGTGTIVRGEWEYTIPAKDAVEMLGLCRSVLHKVRYTIPVTEPGFTHLKWEVDQFHDKGLQGLWLAEIELSSPDEPFPRPAWLGKEVSDDTSYTNVALAETHVIPYS